ncbi:ADP-ribose pyrophosphatase [Aggregatibacter segnis ATCC 33393]|uniref:ADP-ribose pyrophosphatase n=1 Tax=Aggregatibacter segnis ATCC 33393 TaxID=888057 RepID=E6KYK3_9PAST|nr:ADP-ribose pyrophosphatase [Aggregatibacter segnis ATCC 33393]
MPTGCNKVRYVFCLFLIYDMNMLSTDKTLTIYSSLHLSNKNVFQME